MTLQNVLEGEAASKVYGRNLKQRARALVEIAHPEHREHLEREVFKRFSGR